MSRSKKLDMDSLTSMIKKTIRNDNDDRKKALEEFENEFYGKKKSRRKKLLKPEKKVHGNFVTAEKNAFISFMGRKDLTSTEKLMLIYLSHAFSNDGISISVRSLASALGINKNTAMDTLTSLELKGLIEKESTPRGTLIKLLVRVGCHE